MSRQRKLAIAHVVDLRPELQIGASVIESVVVPVIDYLPLAGTRYQAMHV